MPTPSELQAQRADLDRQIAAAMLPGMEAAQEVLNRQCFDDLKETIETIGPESPAGRTVTSLLSLWAIARQQIDREIAKAQALTEQETANAPEAPTETE